ncbi:hypothetical protein [Deinococcus sonorensis]|uniref:Uncharacterized protein n=2 Tax=Deinococcus sonorensis TaxID=309891 RepID=A0AAU7U6J1_9DEIO
MIPYLCNEIVEKVRRRLTGPGFSEELADHMAACCRYDDPYDDDHWAQALWSDVLTLLAVEQPVDVVGR